MDAELVVRSAIEQAGGKLPFARFMAIALYDPRIGYYRAGQDPVGAARDYQTAPHVHALFGGLIARWLSAVWTALGRPRPFTVVEMGAGAGQLAHDILCWWPAFDPELAEAARYLIIEPDRAHIARQRRMLRPARARGARVDWLQADARDLPLRQVMGVFLGNELLDAFPVHLVERKRERYYEVYVAWENGRLVEKLGPPTTPRLAGQLRRIAPALPAEYRTEVNLAALDWMRQIGRTLQRGAVLTIDYGYEAEEYYRPDRARGTLLCHYRHTTNEEPLQRIGQQDITTHVEFTGLMRLGRRSPYDLKPSAYLDQQAFLRQLGLQTLIEEVARARLAPARRESNVRSMSELLDPEGLGRFKVLIQEKKVKLRHATLGPLPSLGALEQAGFLLDAPRTGWQTGRWQELLGGRPES